MRIVYRGNFRKEEGVIVSFDRFSCLKDLSFDDESIDIFRVPSLL